MKSNLSEIFSKITTKKSKRVFSQFFDDRFLTPENIVKYNQLCHRETYPYPHLDDNNRQYCKYIILGSARTGSSLLVELLKSHPSVISFSELFMDQYSPFNYLGYPHHSDENLLDYRNNNPVEFMENLVFKPYRRNISAVGFKLFYYQAHNGRLGKVWNYLKSLDDLKIVHIKRRNSFHSLISSKHAAEKGASKYPEWAMKEIQQFNMGIFPEQLSKGEITIINVDYQECLHYFEKVKSEKDYYEKYFANHSVLNLYYEDLLENMDRECRKLCEFLHLSYAPLKTYAEKQVIAPMKEIVKNYNELKASFEGTEWYSFFDE